jgi:hypothetical protein
MHKRFSFFLLSVTYNTSPANVEVPSATASLITICSYSNHELAPLLPVLFTDNEATESIVKREHDYQQSKYIDIQ